LSYIYSKQQTPFSFHDGSDVFSSFTSAIFETAVFDHTTVCAPIDRVLNVAYKAGIRIVEGCFYYHPATERGWDTVFGWHNISVLHQAGEINIGPRDDPVRKLTYSRAQYMAFVDPGSWIGDSRKYGYELYHYSDGLMSYRAVYLGDTVPPLEKLSFNVPLCGDDDEILVVVNEDFLLSVFSAGNSGGSDAGNLEVIKGARGKAISVRRNAFESCVAYLTTLSPGADITGTAIRHISSRNYIDLQEGVKLVRMPALSYTDALIVSLVCALVSYQIRFVLTNDSSAIIRGAIASARASSGNSSIVSQVLFVLGKSISKLTDKYVTRPLKDIKTALSSSTHIPGVIYDVYSEHSYSVGDTQVDLESDIVPINPDIDSIKDLPEEDPYITFMSGDVKASAPELSLPDHSGITDTVSIKLDTHIPRPVSDPVAALQEFYDEALPGHSTLDIPNVSEQRRTNDLNIATEFVGKVSYNTDVIANENLYPHTPLRTAAIPQSKTAMNDLLLASSKRNWNKPDLQMVTDVYDMAEKFVSEFIEHAMIPGAKEILASKEADPTRFNAVDYCEWLSTRSERFRQTLMEECPSEILALNLEKYNTILKGRVKQKQNVAAQHELPQGQVVIHHDPSTNALFTSVFRQAFNTFDSLLKKNFKSAGRISDSDLSRWFTDMRATLLGSELVEIDSSKYDKSQGLLAQAIEAVMMRRSGVAVDILELFEESYVGNVNSRNLGLAFIIAFQRKSGAADTMYGNLVYNFVSSGRSIGYSRITLSVGKGDDNLIGVVSIEPGEASQRMAYIFNLDAKIILDQVPAFSSGFVVVLEDAVIFAPDPLKRVELLGEINARTGDAKFKVSDAERRERFVSFQDSCSAYSIHGVPNILAECVRSRLGNPTLDVELAIDALLIISKDYSLYEKVVSF